MLVTHIISILALFLPVAKTIGLYAGGSSMDKALGSTASLAESELHSGDFQTIYYLGNYLTNFLPCCISSAF